MIRARYYTVIQADAHTIAFVARELNAAGVEGARVFRKSKGARSKRVDITPATEI